MKQTLLILLMTLSTLVGKSQDFIYNNITTTKYTTPTTGVMCGKNEFGIISVRDSFIFIMNECYWVMSRKNKTYQCVRLSDASVVQFQIVLKRKQKYITLIENNTNITICYNNKSW